MAYPEKIEKEEEKRKEIALKAQECAWVVASSYYAIYDGMKYCPQVMGNFNLRF